MPRLVLARARDMISEKDCWLQRAWKHPRGNGGFQRCAYQAVHDAAQELGLPASGSFKILMKVLGDGRRSAIKKLPEFNDAASHDEVLKLFDLAIGDA
jgi:hypothetical protein